MLYDTSTIAEKVCTSWSMVCSIARSSWNWPKGQGVSAGAEVWRRWRCPYLLEGGPELVERLAVGRGQLGLDARLEAGLGLGRVY